MRDIITNLCYCQQCSLDILNRDDQDFADLCEEGGSIEVDCMGCGLTEVNHEGVCISPWCSYKHGRKTKETSNNETV